MKKILVLVAAMLTVSTVAAQQTINNHLVGVATTADGTQQLTEPSTFIAVDITVEQEQIIPGPYARYAQKLLGTRASLVERSSFAVTDASIGLIPYCEAVSAKPLAEDKCVVASHMGDAATFAKILPDRIENSVIAPEQAAEQAAQMIFSIRKHRMELITGEAGENVFGGGLKDALQVLDEKEAALMELFFGKHITTTTHQRYVVMVQADKKSYPLAGFNTTSGLESVANGENSIISLNITPAESAALKYTPLADARAKNTAEVRVANNATCEVILNEEALCSIVVPIFEFGTTVKIAK